MTKRTCVLDDCTAPHESHGYCVKHLRRWQKHGDPLRVDLDWNTDRRFASRYVVNSDGCWIWQGRDVNQFGHARWIVRGVRIGVHRWAYERFIGPIPDGFVIDHVVCRNPPCVNPAHLEPVTQRTNVARAPTAITTVHSTKTHCIHGHPFSGRNLTFGQNGNRIRRRCRACAVDAQRRYLARKAGRIST